jgi:hypothetical protein
MTGWATWGLFLAWLLHDIEELVTMPYCGWRNVTRLSRIYRSAPFDVARPFSPALNSDGLLVDTMRKSWLRRRVA